MCLYLDSGSAAWCLRFPQVILCTRKSKFYTYFLLLMHDDTMLYDRSHIVTLTTVSSKRLHGLSFSYFATAHVRVGCAAVSTRSYLVPAGKYRRTGLRTLYMRHRTCHTRLTSTSCFTYRSPSTIVRTTFSIFHHSIDTHVIYRTDTPPYDVKRI